MEENIESPLEDLSAQMIITTDGFSETSVEVSGDFDSLITAVANLLLDKNEENSFYNIVQAAMSIALDSKPGQEILKEEE